MRKSENGRQRQRSSVSRAHSYDEIGAFWDTHDLADVAEPPQPASFSVAIKRRRFLVAVEPRLLRRVRQEAARRGLSSESLVNLWLKERLAS